MNDSDPTPADEQRLAELERRSAELEAQIEATRREAKEHGTLPPDHHEPTLVDPGGD